MPNGSFGDSNVVFGVTDTTYGYIQDISLSKSPRKFEVKDADGGVLAIDYSDYRISLSAQYLFRLADGTSLTRRAVQNTPFFLPGCGILISFETPTIFDEVGVGITEIQYFIDTATMAQANNGYWTVSFTATHYIRAVLNSEHYKHLNSSLGQ